MHVEVIHAVQSVGPDVVDQAVAALGDSLGLGPGSSRGEHLGQHVAVGGLDLRGVLYMATGHDQEVHRRGRVYVEEGVGPFGGDNLLGRDIAGDDLAEQAVGHLHEGTVAEMDGRADDGTDDFLADLARWAARERTHEAAAERSRTRSLADQSVSASTWMGLLVDLAEAGAQVTLSVRPGLARSGRLVGVAHDFVVLEQSGRGPLLVRTDALEAVTPSAGLGPATRAGERGAPTDLSLAAALEALAGERAPASVQIGSQTVTGTITGCGEDVVTIRSDGPSRYVYAALNAIAWVEIR